MDTEKKLVSLEDYNAQKILGLQHQYKPIPNGIACPNCGHELVDSSPFSDLTVYPPQKNVHCQECYFLGFRLE